MDLLFIMNSALLGVGLAMDAFSVSLANGLHEPGMGRLRAAGIAGVFALFQAAMPMTGWALVHTAAEMFGAFEAWIPWIALVLLCFIGGKMLWEGLHPDCEGEVCAVPRLAFGALLVQGVATSIDALSVGFTIAGYGFAMALAAAGIIAAVTFVLCSIGLVLGKKFGTRLAGKAGILGGVILILIGVEIFLTGIL